MKTIVTSYVCPPIPTTKFDWLACYDGEEERCQYGWGCTKEEAIADLIENWGEEP